MNRKGFTLIELIIVTAMIGIAITIVGMSVNSIFVFDVTRCAEYIDNTLSTTRAGALTKSGNCYMRLYQDSDGMVAEYFENGLSRERTFLGKGNYTLSATVSDGTTVAIDGVGVVLSFERGTGRFMSIGDAWNMILSPSDPPVTNPNYYTGIVVRGGGKTLTVGLVPSTGKHTIVG